MSLSFKAIKIIGDLCAKNIDVSYKAWYGKVKQTRSAFLYTSKPKIMGGVISLDKHSLKRKL